MRYLFIALFVLSSCATAGKLNAKLDADIGLSEAELVAKHGIPDKTATVGATKMLGFRKNLGRTIDTSLAASFSADPYQTVDAYCYVEFTLRNDRVEKYRYEGNKCVAK